MPQLEESEEGWRGERRIWGGKGGWTAGLGQVGKRWNGTLGMRRKRMEVMERDNAMELWEIRERDRVRKKWYVDGW